jgi:hypothetical protein
VARQGLPLPTSIEVEGPNDSMDKHETQANNQKTIWTNIHYKCLYLEEEAPVCQGQLHKELGYNAISDTTRAILNGIYTYLEDFDEATKKLCKGCALIRQIVLKDSIGIKITKINHWEYWRKAKEETSSFKLGMYFGHYVAGSLLEYIDHFNTLAPYGSYVRGSPPPWGPK